jgi:hypothetical protein
MDYREIASGVHGLGFVPITCVYAKRSKTVPSFLGVSDLADIAMAAAAFSLLGE